MGHPNEDLIRQSYDASSSGDMDTLGELFDPRYRLARPGPQRAAGDHHGVDTVVGYLAKTMELTGGNFRVEIHDIVANDEHAVGLHTAYDEGEGRDPPGQHRPGIPCPRREGHRGQAVLGGPVYR